MNHSNATEYTTRKFQEKKNDITAYISIQMSESLIILSIFTKKLLPLTVSFTKKLLSLTDKFCQFLLRSSLNQSIFKKKLLPL